MNFEYTQEQQQFSDALRRWVDRGYTFEQRKKIISSGPGVSDQAWTMLTELGLTALPVPEEHGGFNGSSVDMMVVMHEIGRGLVVEPYWATMFATQFLKIAGGQETLLEQVGAGAVKMACALGERQSRHDLSDISTGAKAENGGYVINGAKTIVIHGGQADYLVVSVRTAGNQRDRDGISLFVVPSNAPGLERKDYRTIDGQRAADIRFNKVLVPASARLGKEGAAWEVLEAAADYATALLCAEAVGAMEALHGATLDYLKTRQQFGVPIGKFQVLQHRMVDMYMQLELARSMTTLAAVKAESRDANERRRIVSAAKARVGQAMKYVGQQAVQLHGGMGVTNELPAAHHFKRLTMIGQTLGDTDHHLARFAALPEFRQAT